MTSSSDEPERQPDREHAHEHAHEHAEGSLELGDAVPGEPGWTARDDE